MSSLVASPSPVQSLGRKRAAARLVAVTLAAAVLQACGLGAAPTSPLSPTAARDSVARGTPPPPTNPFATVRDTFAGCLAGSGGAACFSAAPFSADLPASPATASVFADCLRGEGGARCFATRPTATIGAALTAPNAPSALTSSVSGTTVTLQWTAPATGDPAAAYLIEAGSASGLSNLATLQTVNAATSLSVPGVPTGTYYVRVRAGNGAGVGPPSNEIVVQVGIVGCGPLGTPTLSVVTNSGGTVGLSWTIPSGGPTAYILEAGSAPGLSNLANVDLRQASPTFTTSGVPPGTYYVRVLARRNDCARSAPSNEVIVNVSASGPEQEPGGIKMLHYHDSDCGPSSPLVIIVDGTFRGGHGEFIQLSPGPHSYVVCLESGGGCGASQPFTVIAGYTFLVEIRTGGGYC